MKARWHRLARTLGLALTFLTLLGPGARAETPAQTDAVALVVTSRRAAADERPSTRAPVADAQPSTAPASGPERRAPAAAAAPVAAPDPPRRLFLRHRALLR